MWYIYTVDYYLAINKLKSGNSQVNGQNSKKLEWIISDLEKQIWYVLAYKWILVFKLMTNKLQYIGPQTLCIY